MGKETLKYPKGEEHHNASLTAEQVEDMWHDIQHGIALREELSAYTDRAIAQRYSTPPSNVHKIRNGIAWRHLTEKLEVAENEQA